MTSTDLASRLVVALLALPLGCGDLTPKETVRVSGGDAAVPEAMNGCAAETYVDRTATEAERVIGFGGERGSGGFAFAPRCMVIAAGQQVTWVGAFASHPLNPGVPGDARGGSPGNPIAVTASGTSASVVFPRAGVFPFVCGMHAFLGMTGVIVVR